MKRVVGLKMDENLYCVSLRVGCGCYRQEEEVCANRFDVIGQVQAINNGRGLGM